MPDEMKNVVKEKYGAVAASALSSADAGVRAVANAFGYSDADLAAIPADANMGLSCGNPTAFASLRPGEVVLDLGCGGGLDVFLAAQKVGPSGRAIGVDMTPAMIDRATKNAAKSGLSNVEFHLATIDRLPLSDASVDVVISNCVINLAPDKPAVFREIARVLKKGGRLAVSDIALKKELPAELANDLMAYVGCIAGAISIDEYRQGLTDTGFTGVKVVDSGADLNAYAKVDGQGGCCSPAMEVEEKPQETAGCCSGATGRLSLAKLDGGACCAGEPEPKTVHGGLGELLKKYDVNDYAASVKVFAVK